MAQWIPKTAWKVSNLNKRYGPSYITSGYGLDTSFPRTPAVYDATQLRQCLSEQKGPVIIDVRGMAERRREAVTGAVALHHHDLLSGAACPILPMQKEASKLFVLTSNSQRGINSCAALRRWGYENVSVVSYDTLVEAGLAGQTATESSHTQPEESVGKTS